MATPRLTRKDLIERQKKFEEGMAVFAQAEEAYEREKMMYMRMGGEEELTFAESHALYAKTVDLLRAAKRRDPFYVSNLIGFIIIILPL